MPKQSELIINMLKEIEPRFGTWIDNTISNQIKNTIKTMQDEIDRLQVEVDKNNKDDYPWCNAEYTILDDDFGQPLSLTYHKYCFYCGKKIK